MNKAVFLSIPAILLPVVLSIMSLQPFPAMVAPNAPQECFNLSVKHGDHVFFGSNDDVPPYRIDVAEATIRIFPPASTDFGYVEFGYSTADGKTWTRNGAVNESGLAYGTMSIPSSPVNFHHERSIKGMDRFYNIALRKASTVDEVIALALQTDFSDLGDAWIFQMQFADASGDAVVISPGADGELAFTRGPNHQPYLTSTNFNRGIPDNEKQDGGSAFDRYDTAMRLIKQNIDRNDLSAASVREILDAVHAGSYGSFTASSRVFDLQTGDVYLYYYSQFDTAARFNLAEVFENGQQEIRMRDLFPEELAARGEGHYRMIEFTYFFVRALALSATLLFLICLGIGVFSKMQPPDPSRLKTDLGTKKLSLGMGLSWGIANWSMVLLIANSYPPNLPLPLMLSISMLVMGVLGTLGILVVVRGFIWLRKHKS